MAIYNIRVRREEVLYCTVEVEAESVEELEGLDPCTLDELISVQEPKMEVEDCRNEFAFVVCKPPLKQNVK